MKIVHLVLLLIITAALTGSGKAWAHHAFSAEFDADDPVTLHGKVSKVEWINPHVWIHLDVAQNDGSVVEWMVEGGTPNTLLRAGLNKNSLPVGTEIVVRGYQSKDNNCKPACKANGRDMVFTDGRKVFMGSSGTGAPKTVWIHGMVSPSLAQVFRLVNGRRLKTPALLLPLVLFASMATAQAWDAPRMPWGDPDLQGVWTNATITTLERPEGMGALVISEEQAQDLERRDAGVFSEIDNLPGGDLPAGKVVGGYNTAWLDPGTRWLRVKGEPRTSIIVEPSDGQVPYSIRGKLKFLRAIVRTQKRNNPEEQLSGDRCVVGYGSTGEPPMLPVEYNNNYQIVQTPGQVMILVEMNHSVRTIRIDGDPLPQQIRPWLGDSTGHWEGDTLVVETTHFHPQESLRGALKHQFYVGMDSTVTERFTRIGEKEIHYAFSVTDDTVYSQPWRGELMFSPSSGEIYEYACHEGNYGMINILAGEREQGVNGIRWLIGLIAHPPEEVDHEQLGPSRFDRKS